MAAPSTHTGPNRTGIQTSPFAANKLEEVTSKEPAVSTEQLKISAIRKQFDKEMDGLGSVPPPGSLKGMLTTGLEMIQGHKPTVFIDKLGERMAFERTGTRLYEALLAKFDALGTWDGGPSREEIEEHCNDELGHFHLIKETIERLGADPTTMTPSADVAGVEVAGALKIITDPRTTLPQALHSVLILEDTDVEGWNVLIALADSIGQKSLAEEFRKAEATEQTHQQRVRAWFSEAVRADAHRELGEQGTA